MPSLPAAPAPGESGVERSMIRLTRLDGKDFVINALLIETVEEVPDTVVSLTTGRKHVVRESADEIVRRVTAYHQSVRGPAERSDA